MDQQLEIEKYQCPISKLSLEYIDIKEEPYFITQDYVESNEKIVYPIVDSIPLLLEQYAEFY